MEWLATAVIVGCGALALRLWLAASHDSEDMAQDQEESLRQFMGESTTEEASDREEGEEW